jgi:hypothetical protein
MVVRIRLKRGRPLLHRPGKNRHVASALGALLTPAALMAYVLGFWRLASDIGVAGEFGITGVFSHWQIWILLAGMLQTAGHVLNRYGRGGDLRGPRELMFRVFPAPARENRDERVVENDLVSEDDLVSEKDKDRAKSISA